MERTVSVRFRVIVDDAKKSLDQVKAGLAGVAEGATKAAAGRRLACRG